MDHKNLEVWRKSFELACNIYKLTQLFPEEEKFGLVSQMRRAAVSIPSNIAEGCGRGTNKETLRFVDIACGSLAELETHLMLANRLEFINSDSFINELNVVGKLLSGFKRYLKEK